MPSDDAVQSTAITSDERIRNALRRQIQRAYDKGDFSRASLAQESGVNIHTIDSIVSRDASKHRRVAAEDALNLAYTLGDEAVSAVMATIRYTAQRADAPEPVCVPSIVAEGLQHFTVIAQAASDGRIDHTEKPACEQAADALIATVLPLSSAGRAA
jgi:hypothetical protein